MRTTGEGRNARAPLRRRLRRGPLEARPHRTQPVARALAHTGLPFRAASSAIDMWS
jgi:hypothetical protein